MRAATARILAASLAFWFSVSFACAQADSPPSAGAAVYVVRRGWHVDVGFAAVQLAPPLDALEAEFPGAKYLFFGFGDRRYLMAKHRNTPAMLAALWPGDGLLLVTALAADPAQAFGAGHVIEVKVSTVQMLAAQDFIWGSLTDSASVARGPYPGSAYFGARAEYSAFHTCNTWVAEVLLNAGLPVTSRGVLFAGQIWRQVRRLNNAGPSGAGPDPPRRSCAWVPAS
jgi:hypothetical protein